MTPKLHTIAKVRFLAAILSTMIATPAALARSDPGGAAPVAPVPEHLRAILPANRSGTVRPPAGVDPGILRPAPALPRQSTPVINPDRLHHEGQGAVRVVPK